MHIKFFILIISTVTLGSRKSSPHVADQQKAHQEQIMKVEMNLSSFGVESDGFPSINVFIDFRNDSSNCFKWYDNPAYKSSTYKLSTDEIKKILTLLKTMDLEKIKKEYTFGPTDQPSSTTTIYTSTKKIVVKDYALQGEYPMQQLYKLVYKY